MDAYSGQVIFDNCKFLKSYAAYRGGTLFIGGTAYCKITNSYFLIRNPIIPTELILIYFYSFYCRFVYKVDIRNKRLLQLFYNKNNLIYKINSNYICPMVEIKCLSDF